MEQRGYSDEVPALAAAAAPLPDMRQAAEEIAANNCNYFVPHMAFGDMTLTETLRSIELFSKEVMPTLA